MNLLIISGMPHYLRDGQVVGWGPTALELTHLASVTDEIRHIAPLHPGPAPASALPYTSSRLVFVPVPATGGSRLRDKLDVLQAFPTYLKAILGQLRWADAVHVRCPDNISLLSIVLLALVGKPSLRWVKYAGNWRPQGREAWTYRFQRCWLQSGLHRGLVTVNGHWPDQPAHVHSFLNPCLTEVEIDEGSEMARHKKLQEPLQLLFVGRLESAKGAGVCLEILAGLEAAGVTVHLDLIGEGKERLEFEGRARDLNLVSRVKFHGGLPRTSLGEFYGKAHFILLPTICSEGWPKVLSEAMAYGVVPISTSVSSIPQFLRTFSTGEALRSREPRLFSRVIEDYLKAPARWSEHSQNAVKAARQFSYTNYLRAVRQLLGLTVTATA